MGDELHTNLPSALDNDMPCHAQGGSIPLPAGRRTQYRTVIVPYRNRLATTPTLHGKLRIGVV